MTTAARTPKRLYPSDDIRAYERWVRRQKGYGRWEPFVDAQPARDHLFHLMATTGAGWRRLADAAGVPQSTVTYLLYGNGGRRAKRITPGNARKLLALQADSTRGVTLPSTGTQRRIQVLIGEGWPQIHLGPQIGTHPQYVHELLKTARVTTTTAAAVADAYARLQDIDPLTCGATPHGVGIALRLAARNQWPDRVFWDDYQDRIDDPDFDPATADGDLGRNELGALRRREIIHLASYGYTRQTIHKRLVDGGHNIAESTVQGVLTEYRAGVRRDRRKRVDA